MRLIAVTALFTALLTALVACAGSSVNSGPLDAPEISPNLPAPADINVRSTSALTDALNGSDFETAGLEPHFVSVAGFSALFEPPGGDTGFGYAMYAFELTDYSGEQSLTNAWTTGPTEPGALWIALSDWQQDAWVWFAVEADSDLAIPDITQYMDGADVLLAVVLVNIAGAYNLDLLYFAEFPPAIVSVSPTGGAAGVERIFSAEVTGLRPLSYAWDFGGGAIPNVSSEASPTVTLGAAGTYSASLTVTNPFDSDSFFFDLEVEDVFEPGVGQLIAQAESETAGVGESVRIVVTCGDFPAPFKYMNGVAVTVEEGAEYVHHSLNVGAPGGDQKDVDGLWTSVSPATFLLPDDDLHTEAAVEAEPARVFIAFSVIPLGGAESSSGGDLFNFLMQFNVAGTYTLGFLEFQAVKRTYYSDEMSVEYNWADISNSGAANTIVVSE